MSTSYIIERLANFPQSVETVQIEDSFSFDSGRRPDFSLTDSSDEVVEKAIRGICEVWNELSYGYLEPVYYRALEAELGLEPFFLDQELAFDVFFDGKPIGTQKVKSVLNSDIWVVWTSTTKSRQGLERKIRSIEIDLAFVRDLGNTFWKAATDSDPPVECLNRNSKKSVSSKSVS